MKVIAIMVRSLGALLAAIVVLAVALLAHGYGLAHKSMSNPEPTLVVAPDTALIARGAHLSSFVCSSCHAPSLSRPDTLSGGAENFFLIPNGPNLGVMYAPNLTPASNVAQATDGQLSRAIREGVGFDHRPLIVMPSANLRNLSDRDLAAVISFVRAQPAVKHDRPASQFNLLAYLVLGMHQAETSAQLPVTRPAPEVAEGATAAYGDYFIHVAGCTDCHGRDFKGAPKNSLAPHGPSLVALVNSRQPDPYGAFEGALRHGVRPSGGTLDPTMMPWPSFARLSDVEVQALYAYLKSLPQ
jgi:cytochrome c553